MRINIFKRKNKIEHIIFISRDAGVTAKELAGVKADNVLFVLIDGDPSGLIREVYLP